LTVRNRKPVKRGPGRPRSASAIAHDRILDAVFELLQTQSIRDLQIQEVCRKAGVSKPTIYKWWPTKAAMVMAMFEQRMVRRLPPIEVLSAEKLIRVAVPGLIRLFNGPFGKVAAEMIAAGQSEPAVLREFRDRYVLKRRKVAVKALEDAYASGEMTRSVDPELLLDLIFGPIYFRLLVKHQPLDHAFGKDLLDYVLRRAVTVNVAGDHDAPSIRRVTKRN
jgi:AcrR family transcriptional regulator